MPTCVIYASPSPSRSANAMKCNQLDAFCQEVQGNFYMYLYTGRMQIDSACFSYFFLLLLVAYGSAVHVCCTSLSARISVCLCVSACSSTSLSLCLCYLMYSLSSLSGIVVRT